jgi:hypothetical protein
MTSAPSMPAPVAALHAQLAEGERLAWVASPEPSVCEPKARRTEKWDSVAILGGGYSTLAAGVMAVRTGHWLWLSIPISFLGIGVLVYLVARWMNVRARRSLEGTVYGVTTRRALIVHTYPALAVQTLPLAAIADITTIDKRGDFADLRLDATSASAGLLFQGVARAERARHQLMRVVRDPQGTEQELAAWESYASSMRHLAVRPVSH